MTADIVAAIRPHRARLDIHPIYDAIATPEDLRVFMAHHVYSVWDFMSLTKFLQGILAPVRVPWVPVGDPLVRRFVNEIVLEEESDEGIPGSAATPQFISHFELYCHAMAEAGADPGPARAFVAIAGESGIAAALDAGLAPQPAAAFTRATFAFIDAARPHAAAAAFAMGREHIIPGMFRSLLARMRLDAGAAPAFHHYLRRHIHLNGIAELKGLGFAVFFGGLYRNLELRQFVFLQAEQRGGSQVAPLLFRIKMDFVFTQRHFVREIQ